MNWYYALGGQQQGPVDDARLDALLAAGTLTPDTLVWREGMANWQPLRVARPATPAPGAPPLTGLPPIVAGPAAASGEVVCVECGKTFPRDGAIQYGTSWVCAACKPVFLQKLREGAATGGAGYGFEKAFDPEAFLAETRERGYDIDIVSCFSRGWQAVKSRFWLSMGAVILVYLCIFAASAIPCVGGLVQLAIQGPLMAGLSWFFIKLVRDDDPSLGDAFVGFSPLFLQTFLVNLVSGILTGLCMIPGIAVLIAVFSFQARISPAIIVVAVLVGFIPALYLTISWMFSAPLVVDKKISFWPAMELSRKVVAMHWFKVFLLVIVGFLMVGIVIGLAAVGGVAAAANRQWLALAGCISIGLLWTAFLAPTILAALMTAYNDIFNPRPAPIT